MGWRERLDKMFDEEYMNIDKIIERKANVVGDRTCLTNDSGAIVGINEDGDINVKSTSTLGMSIDREGGTVSIIGTKLSLMFKEIDIYTLPFMLRINKSTLNTVPILPPGAGPILPDAPIQMARGLQGILKQVTKIAKG